MVKSVVKRFLSIALVIVMVLTLLPAIQMPANAAAVTGLADSSIGLEGDEAWSASTDSITGSVTGTAGELCGGGNSTESTLTIKNNKSATATLSFDYALTLNDGSVTIDGSGKTENGSFTKELPAGDSIQIKIKSDEDAKMTTIKMTNVKLISNVSVTITFVPGAHGTFKVDGNAITAQTSITKNSTETFQLAATPASGYKFFGWKNTQTGAYISRTATYTWQTDTAQTIQPVFVVSSAPVFETGGMPFSDLNEAIQYATAKNQKKITLTANGTLPAGNYTIPSGVTLLIPFDDLGTVYTDEPEVVYGSHTTPSAFRTLTMAKNANITVASGASICLPSKLSATGTGSGSWNGTPTGKYGHIKMSDGSSITVQNGATLYCYGYISGSGSVKALSGATVWEAMQFRCWRGGTATSAMKNKSVFPMNQYYVQNIEAPLTLDAGATEKVYTSVNATKMAYPAGATFIGSNGMFRINSGSVTKRFDGPTDRLVIDVDGNVSISALSLSLSVVSLNTQSFVLPINSNITININSGTTSIANSQQVAFLPGSVVNVAEGANLLAASSVFVYDQDQWGAYAATGANLVPVGYSVANGTTTKRTSANLVDAKFDVNGTITVSGALYTTSGGAEIVSSGKTGKVVLTQAAPSNTNTQQVTQNDTDITYVNIPVTAAQLKNGVADPQFTATAGSAANTTFTYCAVHDKWEQDTGSKTVTFNANGGTGSMDTQQTCPAGGVTLAANAFTREGYVFTGWNTAADGSGTAYADEAEVMLSGNVTLYAQWKVKTFTVKWLNLDGTELKTMADVPYGTTVNASAYDGEAPKMPDDEYAYTFTGWSADSAVITEDTYFVAQYDKQVLEYTVDLYFHVDGIDDELGGTVTLAANKSMKLTATPTYKTGGVTYFFDHWEFGVDDNTKLVYPAMSVTIRPSQAGRFTAYAVYSTTEKTDFEPFVMIIRDKMVGTKLVKTLTYSLTDDFTLVPGSVGFTVENADGQVIGSAFSQNLKGKTGTYTVTVANATEAVKVIAHITYQDANGAEFTKTAQ